MGYQSPFRFDDPRYGSAARLQKGSGCNSILSVKTAPIVYADSNDVPLPVAPVASREYLSNPRAVQKWAPQRDLMERIVRAFTLPV